MGTRFRVVVLGSLLPLLPLRAPAAELCSDSLSTAVQTQCLMAALQAQDRALDQALARVAQEAKQVPGPTFHALWRENLTSFYRTSDNP